MQKKIYLAIALIIIIAISAIGVLAFRMLSKPTNYLPGFDWSINLMISWSISPSKFIPIVAITENPKAFRFG